MISTRDINDEEIENMSFENSKEMAKKLKTLANTNDTKISYVDIYMPVPLLQVGTYPHYVLFIVKAWFNTMCVFTITCMTKNNSKLVLILQFLTIYKWINGYNLTVVIIQGNVIIVDTPGFGDQEQKDVADKMMSYLPNALSFVFVLNVSNAGGIQDDRV